MQRLTWLLAGASSLAVALGVSVVLFLRTQASGLSTREQPGRIESWAAQRLRAVAVPQDAKERRNPQMDSPETLAEARAHWADHCAICHSNNGSGDVAIGQHLFPPSPDMRQAATQNRSDGELFYIIQNGIRHTGMPSLGQR